MTDQPTPENPPTRPTESDPRIFEILVKADRQSPPNEFIISESDARILTENLLRPAARRFLKDNPNEDELDLISHAHITVARTYRAVVKHPAIASAERTQAENHADNYLFKSIRNAFLKEYARNGIYSELRERISRIDDCSEFTRDATGDFVPNCDPNSPMLSGDEVDFLASKIGFSSGKGWSANFQCNLPSPSQLNLLLRELFRVTDFQKSIPEHIFIEIAKLVFMTEENQMESLDHPVQDDIGRTQAEIIGSDQLVANDAAHSYAPSNPVLDSEVQECEQKILERIASLDSKPMYAKDRAFFRLFFEFYLWKKHPVARSLQLTATKYSQRIGIPDATLSSREKLLVSELSKLRLKETGNPDFESKVAFPEDVFLAALTSLRENHIKIFRKFWSSSDLSQSDSIYE